MVVLNIEDITITKDLDPSLSEQNDIELMDEIEVYKENTGTWDYERLQNLPKLNGDTIIGSVEEKDPTVPLWAKAAEKPTYSQEEIGVGVIPLSELDKLFNSL